MKKTQRESNRTDSSKTFYSARGVTLLLSVVLILAVLALCGMYSLGVIRPPATLAALFGAAETTARPAQTADIAPATEATTLTPALAREEYAAALGGMQMPSAYYRAYTVSIYSGNASVTTQYDAVVRDADWWVRETQDGVALSTAVCQSGSVKITDHTQNQTATATAASADTPGGIRLAERMGVMPLDELTALIGALGEGDAPDYGGGITGYSLALTPARGTGENVFTFDFTTASGVREAYSFSFENAVLLTAEKYVGDHLIYKMESTAYKNDLTAADTAGLFD